MDPLSALGVAASVVQFIDYATKKCRNLRKLYELGALYNAQDVEAEIQVLKHLKEMAFDTTAHDFVEFSTMFRGRKRFARGEDDEEQKTEAAMDHLIDDCSKVAQELASHFDRLAEIRRSRGEHFLKKTIEFMRLAWRHEDAMKLADQLATYQNQLVLRMLQYLNTRSESAAREQGHRFDALEKRIVEVLAVSQDKLSLIRGQNETLRQRVDEADARGTSYHEQTLAAILTLQNGETKFLTARGSGAEGSRPAVANSKQTLVTMKASSIDDDGDPGDASVAVQPFRPIQDAVLRCLWFRQSGDRYDTVQKAHLATYEWIFRGPRPETPKGASRSEQVRSVDPGINLLDETQPWAPFVPWLEDGSGCYWINGKAGSGKSTLMKFIYEDSRTRLALKKWATAGNRELERVSFFFWNLGSEMQKSQKGLLSSLLYSVLQQRPYLISVIMPELWMARATLTRGHALDAPSYPELLRWFRRLIDQAGSQLRLFFLIDGLDEYDGDYFDIIDLIKEASANPNVKFLLSSRPIPSCIDAFSECPNLRLQDLTRGDIKHYTEDLLKARLEKRHPAASEDIIDQIVDKSCGVFLWVILVVRSVLEGLQNWDTLAELRQRLDELPSNLKDLYTHMLRRLSPAYRQQASELFQITLNALDVQDSTMMLPLLMFFATENESAVLDTPVKQLSHSEENDRREAIEGRIRSRCCGLLEVLSVDYSMRGMFSSGVVKHQYVGFFHRTAVEFLRFPEVWENLLVDTSPSGFQPWHALFRGCVLMCKTAELEGTIHLDSSPLWHHMGLALVCASLSEEAGVPVSTAHLLELDNAMARHWKEASRCSFRMVGMEARGHWTKAFSLWHDSAEPIDQFDAAPNLIDVKSFKYHVLSSAAKPTTLHSLAVAFGLCTFIIEQPPSTVPETSNAPRLSSRLLFDAVRYLLVVDPWPAHRADALRAHCATICTILLQQPGVDPDAGVGYNGESAWSLMLQRANFLAARRQEFRSQYDLGSGVVYLYVNLLLPFIEAGANPNAIVTIGRGRDGQVQWSALKALQALLASDDEYGENDWPATARTAPPPGAAGMDYNPLEELQHTILQRMVEKEAIVRVWKDGRLVSGPPEPATANHASRSRLALPGMNHFRSKSAEDMSIGKRKGVRKINSLLSGLFKAANDA